MTTPAELRKLTELGKQKKKEREVEDRKLFDKKAKEAGLEKSFKDEAEAQRIIVNLSSQLRVAADAGFPTARVYTIPSSELQFKNPYQKKLKGKEQTDYILIGISKLIFDHFKKEGFEVVVEEQAPYDPVEGPATESYHIRVGW
jgi:hypothetical protein